MVDIVDVFHKINIVEFLLSQLCIVAVWYLVSYAIPHALRRESYSLWWYKVFMVETFVYVKIFDL